MEIKIRMSDYIFTGDYFSNNIKQWEKIQSDLNATFGNNLRCLEVGAWEGRSALYLLDNFVGNSSLTVIDYFILPNIHTTYLHNINLHPKKQQVNTIVGSSLKELPKLMGQELFDFIYIDAGKTSADNLANLIISERLLKVNGIMVVDDFGWTKEGTENKHTPNLGISAFKEITLLCEVYMEYYQVAFKKVNDNGILFKLNR